MLFRSLNNARLNALGSLGNAMNGHHAASAVYNQTAQSGLNQIKDYSRCPSCGSIDLVTLTKEQFEAGCDFIIKNETEEKQTQGTVLEQVQNHLAAV